MDRVCGASVERDRLSQSRCWCRGLFCGRGGAKLSRQLRHDFHVTGHASSVADFESLIAQQDLFNGEALRDKWLTRLALVSGARRVSTSTPTASRASHVG